MKRDTGIKCYRDVVLHTDTSQYQQEYVVIVILLSKINRYNVSKTSLSILVGLSQNRIQ